MIERIQVDLDIVEGENELIDMKLNDSVNEAYTMLFAVSTFVSPLIGTALYEIYGMPKVCDMIALFNFGLAAICFIFNLGPFYKSEN